MSYDARIIANKFLERAFNQGSPLTNMQLQKLPYIAHGWCLAVMNKRLISSNPQTWPYGPIFPDLYEALKIYGPGKVSDFIHKNDPIFDPSLRGSKMDKHLTKNEERLLDKIWDEYGHMDGWTLSAITHKKDAPWSQVSNYGERGYLEIPPNIIKSYYQGLLHDNVL